MKSTIIFLLGAVNAIIDLGLGFCIAAEIGIQISDDYESLFSPDALCVGWVFVLGCGIFMGALPCIIHSLKDWLIQGRNTSQ